MDGGSRKVKALLPQAESEWQIRLLDRLRESEPKIQVDTSSNEILDEIS